MKKMYFFGFTLWKRNNIKKFFSNDDMIIYCWDLKDALKKGLDENSKIYIWGKKPFEDVEKFAKDKGININRVEDGFIRSVTLGSDLTKAYSIVVDSRGIYFDPTQESDLEWIYNNYNFTQEELQRAEELKKYLIEKKISKYNALKDKKLNINTDKKIILVPGQVEDDASIIYGGDGMSNLELLKKVKAKRGDEFIIYKPHPDVLAGNRKGNIPKKQALKYADMVIEDVSLPSLLEICDEVHTITSLSGFEGLIRDKKVYTYGMPFYAGWGLTYDEKICKRRKRKLTINELIAGAYIIYPRYISPKTGELCEVEVLIKELEELKNRYNNEIIYRLFTDIRNNISRKIQLLLRVAVEQSRRFKK
jgi:capsular polysaccharide export protein